MMTYDVLVTKEHNKRYKARVLLLPEIVATGSSEEDVLAQVKSAITVLRTRSRIVQIDVPPLAAAEDDPWLRYAGMWADDPDWDAFQAEVAAVSCRAGQGRGKNAMPIHNGGII
ncbi:type II toxin-antitoxin system HicB family antitoxin [Arthrospira platensis SPKY1]|nr:type II toxin-antitoxin system HicB family antitoxin [Arthrospira platensis SPKY1]